MYTPSINNFSDITEIMAFINRFSFGLLISLGGGRIIGTHIPILASNSAGSLKLFTHIALANSQWKDIEGQEVLAVFTEPHAYISTSHYTKEETVPTWNYVAVHIYGKAVVLHDAEEIMDVMNRTMLQYEPAYHQKWHTLPETFRTNMLKGIVAFRIDVTEVQGKAKLSQNKTATEIENIIGALNNSTVPNEALLAEYMQRYAQLPGK